MIAAHCGMSGIRKQPPIFPAMPNKSGYRGGRLSGLMTQIPCRQVASCAGLLTLLCIKAMAADAPHMLGTWMIPDKPYPVPGETNRPAALTSLVVKILRQDGDTFSGTVIGPKRKLERIIGSIRRDGKTFIYSSERTAGVGKVQDDQMELCRTDAGCAVLTRTR